MRITHLKYFIEVSTHKNITAVAHDHGVSLQAISRQIRELETELGFKLFDRRNNGVSLTPEGEIFLKRAKKAVRAFDKCLEPLEDTQE